jgi:hypothetical protein
MAVAPAGTVRSRNEGARGVPSPLRGWVGVGAGRVNDDTMGPD